MSIFILASCSHEKFENDKVFAAEKDTIAPPFSILVTNPIIPDPDTCITPLTLSFPKSGTIEKVIPTRNGPRKIKLSAPETKPADFFVNMQIYNMEQGLALSGVLCGCLDKMGNLWFGTFGGGVSRYDGKSFTNFTTTQGLADNTIKSIIEDKRGNIWIGTNGGGVSCYDGKSFANFTSVQGLANNFIRCIIEDKAGNIWFATAGGITRYTPLPGGTPENGIFKNFTAEDGLVNNNVSSVTQDRIGNIWFATDGGISRYNTSYSGIPEKGLFTNFTVKDGLADNTVNCITEDLNQNLWCGTNKGVSRYNPFPLGMDGKGLFLNYTTKQGLPNNIISCITEDKSGNLWFGTQGGGASCYDPSATPGTSGNLFLNLTKAQGLPNNFVTCITKDKMGYLWFGALGDGIGRFEGKSFSSFSTLRGIENVWSITEDKKGNIWFATNEDGISCFTPSVTGKKEYGYFTKFTTEQGLSKNNTFCVFTDKEGNIWIGTDEGGVICFDGKTFKNFTTQQGLVNNTVRYIMQDSKGNLWFGTYGGVSYACPDKRGNYSFTNFTTEQGLANNIVRHVMEDKNGNIWFGTADGASCFTPSSKSESKEVGTFTNYTTAQGLTNNAVRCITEDKSGNLWIGTLGGLNKMTPTKSNENLLGKGKKLFENFTVKDGLSNDVITQIIEDKNGNMFFGTNEGITVLKAGTHSFEIYNNKSGYPVKDINGGEGALFLDHKGIIWAAVGNKVERFDYSGIHKSPVAPNVFLQSIKIQEENIVWNLLSKKTNNPSRPMKLNGMSIVEENLYFGRELSDSEIDTMRFKFSDISFDSITRFYPLPENLVLPYKHNNITFDFAAIEPARPSMVRYQYKLEGYEKDWRPITGNTSATFGNINEGTYTFKLKARSPDGVWSLPITYSFKVLPPWWRTWWMYFIYLIAGSLGIWRFIYWRERNMRREKDLLEEKVALRTDQLKQQKKLVEVRNREIIENMIELEKLSLVASKTNNGVMICDKDGAFEYMNEGMQRMLGYTLEEVKERFGKFIKDFSHNPEIDKSIQQAIAERTPITYEALNTTKAGKNIWISSTITPIENSKGELHKIVVIDVDVTENKRKSIEIQQSIDYAKRIQSAILPDVELINASLPNSFVLYKPKDVVSGDFYWFKIWNESIVIASVDCTGHGVPGALMSAIGSNILHQIAAISPINKPGWVLENLHEQVRAALHQDLEGSESRDGMDIVMCKINLANKELEFAGANRPLYYISGGVLTIIRGNNYAIGGYQDETRRKFTNHKIKLSEGDTIYLCTDGYSDQFGGKYKKKFMNKRFRNLLLDIQDKTMEEQKIILNDTFKKWKGSEEQVDDILVIGVKV